MTDRVRIACLAALWASLLSAEGWADGEFESHRKAGQGLWKQKEYGKAIGELRQALKLKQDPAVLVELGNVNALLSALLGQILLELDELLHGGGQGQGLLSHRPVE